jgi:ABC-type glycerol-3-phosphate transport system substrate-binding protein
MNARMRRLEAITRRDALLGLAAAGGGLMRPGDAFAQAAQPWSMAPRSKVDKLNFVAWTYGDIYARIARQFEADWGVKVESTISSFNDHPTKLATMFAGGEKIDVSQSSPFSFPNFIKEGMVEPLDGLAGAADYVKDYSGFTKEVAVVDGKLMGLPYFAAIWVWNYNDEMLQKAGIARPFSTYEEFIEHCLKAKKDGHSRYPVLWVAGRTKDGEYTQAVNLAKDAMLGSGYNSVMQSDAVKTGWAPWGDVDAILKMWDKATYIGTVVPSLYQPWHFPWTDQLNIEVQKCLTGQITADQCCDNLIKGIADAKRKT